MKLSTLENSEYVSIRKGYDDLERRIDLDMFHVTYTRDEIKWKLSKNLMWDKIYILINTVQSPLLRIMYK